MLKVIFTLDYEIHGNGEGCPQALMIEPTMRMLRLFNQHGAKLTIMADIGEILKFKELAERGGGDLFHYQEIANQLREAVATGHDVQLHIHSSYFNSTFDGQRWVQDWSEYNFAGLDPRRMTEMVRQGKEFLETLLKPVNPGYQCVAFRAANWSVSPAKNVARALLENGIRIDTSVFKYGRRSGLVNFDYSSAHSDLFPWPASEKDLCVRDEGGKLWEFPIYSEKRWIGAFLTANRIYRAAQGRGHRISDSPAPPESPMAKEPGKKKGLLGKLSLLTKSHAWKADFNQCTGRQLIQALHRAERKIGTTAEEIPFVLIGHSKIFSRWNEQSLRPFLAEVARRRDRFGFGTFGDFASRNTIDSAEGRTVAGSLLHA